MTQLETIAVLLNGGHIVWMHPSDPGPSYYKVILPSHSDTEAVGWLTDRTAFDLFKAGFLVSDNNVSVVKDGYTESILKLGSGNLDFLGGKRKRVRSALR